MANNVTSIALLGSNDILLLFSCFCLQGSGPKMGEIAKFIYNGKNFALLVKAHFTSKPVLPFFTSF